MGSSNSKPKKRMRKNTLHTGCLSTDGHEKNTGFDNGGKPQAPQVWTLAADGKAVLEVGHLQCDLKLLCHEWGNGVHDGSRDDSWGEGSDGTFLDEKKFDLLDERRDYFLDEGSDDFLDEGNDFVAERKDTVLAESRDCSVHERWDDFLDEKGNDSFDERKVVCADRKRSNFLSETVSEDILDESDSFQYQSSETFCEGGTGHFFNEWRTDSGKGRNVICGENKVSLPQTLMWINMKFDDFNGHYKSIACW